MAKINIGDLVLWDDPWRRDWGVPMDTREWTVFDVREDMVCICTGTFGSSGYAEAEVPPQELRLLWTARLKVIAIKAAIIVARVVWAFGALAVGVCGMYIASVVLGVFIPEGTSVWVRFIIGVPVIFVVPFCLVWLFIKLSRKLDKLSDYRVLELRPLGK